METATAAPGKMAAAKSGAGGASRPALLILRETLYKRWASPVSEPSRIATVGHWKARPPTLRSAPPREPPSTIPSLRTGQCLKLSTVRLTCRRKPALRWWRQWLWTLRPSFPWGGGPTDGTQPVRKTDGIRDTRDLFRDRKWQIGDPARLGPLIYQGPSPRLSTSGSSPSSLKGQDPAPNQPKDIPRPHHLVLPGTFPP